MNTHAAPAPRRRRRVLLATSLIVGTVGSIALMVASQWVPLLQWAALAVALGGGFLATWASVVEFREWRERSLAEAAEMRAAERERTASLHETQRSVLTTVDARVTAIASALDEARDSADAARTELVGTKAQLGEARIELSSLRGNLQALRVENDDLRSSLAAFESADSDAADVLALPRRRVVGENGADADEAQTVVVLDLQRLTQPYVAEVQARHAN